MWYNNPESDRRGGCDPVNGWGITDKGKQREGNEDFFIMNILMEHKQLFAVVCDGMGGAQAGEVASKMAAQAFEQELKRQIRPDMSRAYIRAALVSAVNAANDAVYTQAISGEEYDGMGTTLAALLIDGEDGVIANVGDSRVYMISDGAIRQATRDHSVVEEMISRGEITRKQARTYPGKNLITRVIGTDPAVDADTFEFTVREDTAILLCTDGLTNMLDEQEILLEIVQEADPAACCERLIESANKKGGDDNITVVFIKI